MARKFWHTLRQEYDLVIQATLYNAQEHELRKEKPVKTSKINQLRFLVCPRFPRTFS